MGINFEEIYEKFEGRVPCIKGCSKCCQKAEFIVLLPFEKEYLCNKVPEAKKHIINRNINGEEIYLIQQPCPFLKNGLCSIERDRPFDCRAFPLDYCMFNDKMITFTSKNCPALNNMSQKDIREMSKIIISVISKLEEKWVNSAMLCGPCGNCEHKSECNIEELVFDNENW